MSCSNPWRLYPEDIKTSFKTPDIVDHRWNAMRSSLYHNEYYTVPCGVCLNCRVDRQNSLIDRAEYELFQYRCGAFVTFTFDDYHLEPYCFIDSHTGNKVATLDRKCGKDFLNRLNKNVHKAVNYAKKKGVDISPLCRPDYKYILTGEYGDKFNRPHFHCIFFGLDFAFCKKLFYRSWLQGSIQVDPIRQGGIKYAVKYISTQDFGDYKFYKYTYHHLIPPYSVHSVGLGVGLYTSQLNYIKEHNCCYRWHNVDRPLPAYYKNKFLILSGRSDYERKTTYIKQCNNIYNLYEHKITSYKDFTEYRLKKSREREHNLSVALANRGNRFYSQIERECLLSDLRYSNVSKELKKRNSIINIVDIQGNDIVKFKTKKKFPFTNNDLFKLGTSYNQLASRFGYQFADKVVGKNITDPIPF